MDEPCVHYHKPHPFFPRPIGIGCAECEAEEYAAWQASVKVRLDEALTHIALGIPYTWDELPCVAYPLCGLTLGSILPPWGAYPGTPRLRHSA